jgi:hypothetical protein
MTKQLTLQVRASCLQTNSLRYEKQNLLPRGLMGYFHILISTAL